MPWLMSIWLRNMAAPSRILPDKLRTPEYNCVLFKAVKLVMALPLMRDHLECNICMDLLINST